MEKVGGITHPAGFYAAGMHSGIKPGRQKDLAFIFSDAPCTAAGTFTTNVFKSYSLLWSLKNINNNIRGVLVNSGNANTCNGIESREKTALLMEELSSILKVESKQLLFASTGSIGKPLPYAAVSAALPCLVNSKNTENHTDAAKAIMTTDLTVKEASCGTGIKGRKKEVVIGAMAKGSGMINPSMATMLAFISTDAVISPRALKSALKDAVEETFNMITVDNDTSTNDMVVCLANGLAGNPAIQCGTADYDVFAGALKKICRELAVKIVSDGEGATRLIEVKVKGAWCLRDAKRVAKKVAGSSLFKSAVYGGLPNWGRILSAAGAAHAKIDTEKTEVAVCGTVVYKGVPVEHDVEALKKKMLGKKIDICMDIGKGRFEATGWGCDLTEEYVRINKE